MAGDLEGFGAPIVGDRHIVADRLEHLKTFPMQNQEIANKSVSDEQGKALLNFPSFHKHYDYLMTDKTWIMMGSNFEGRNF